MPHSTIHTNRSATGFSLIELLVVVAVIALLATLAVPAFNAITNAGSIEHSADQIAGACGLARQTAVSKNRSVEVRFYEVPAEGWPSDFRAFQLFEIGDSGEATALTKVFTLRLPAIISRDTGLSTLLDNARPKRTKEWTVKDPQVALPRAGTTYECRAFRFRPNGTTDLPIDTKWHLTVVDAKKPGSAAQPPDNFATVWVEPATGAVKILRP
jgi:uncharacterized protein (TIGR02596 family)